MADKKNQDSDSPSEKRRTMAVAGLNYRANELKKQKLERKDECNSTHIEIESDDDDDDDPPLRPLPTGFRFRPSDFEMSNYFLKNKALGLPIETCIIIPEESEDIFSTHPSDFPGYPEEKHWYFYCWKPVNQAPQNLWTKIGEEAVFDRKKTKLFGFKQEFTLTEQPNEEEWFMDEISLLSAVSDLDWVLCHVFCQKKTTKEEEEE